MFSITKMKALWDVFSKGKAVANPHMWASHQISVNMLAGLFVAILQLAKVFGHDFDIDTETCTTLAVGIISITNVGITIASSKAHGLPAPQPPLPSLQQGSPTDTPQSPMQPVPDATTPPSEHISIDADIVARALRWAAEHSKSTDNGLHSDA